MSIATLERLLLQEGANIDNQVIGMLARAGIGAPGKEGRETRDNVLTALKSIRVGNDRNAPYLYYWDVNPNVRGTGKTILPIVQYMIDAYKAEGEGAQIPAILNRIGDAVRLKHSLKTTASKSWEGLKKNKDTDTLEKLEAWLRNESGRAENKIKVHTSEFNFPELEVYSDKNVDCYKADTPAEAIELGDKYTFCISYKGGGNQFYTYRFGTHPSWGAKQKTSCYFVWFKDAEGNKNHSDMIVLHVGENGNYMATESQNGIFPWLSKSELLEKYPVLRPALPYMPYKEPTKEEEIAQYFDEDVNVTYEPIPDGTDLSQVRRNNLAKYDPKYLGMIISTGVHLDNEAFEYVFKTIDNSDLVRGNQGDSITKKYIEIGYHPLTPAQVDMLKEAGYEKEVDRAMEIRIRRRLSRDYYLTFEDLDFIIMRSSKEELADPNNAVHKYIIANCGSGLELSNRATEYLIQSGLPNLAYAPQMDIIKRGEEEHSRWDDDVFKVALEYVDKGDIKKKDSVVRKYLSDMSHNDITDGMRKILVDNGYSKAVAKYDSKKEEYEWEVWSADERVEVEETSKGYIITYNEKYYNSNGYMIPDPPKKPVIEIRIPSKWDVKLYFERPRYNIKKLPVIKDLDGKVLKDYKLTLHNVPPLTEFEVSWDGVKEMEIESSRLTDLKGLPEVPKGRELCVRWCSKVSLEGLKGSDFSLSIVREIKSFKGMPKKLDTLTLRMDKDDFDKLEDKSMPDEVKVMNIDKNWGGNIEVLPKRIGALKLTNPSNKITAKDVEYLGVLPPIGTIVTYNAKWYASHTTEENLKEASVADKDRYEHEYKPVFYGANSSEPIAKKIESPHIWKRLPVYVYPFVSSLKGLICPKAIYLDRTYDYHTWDHKLVKEEKKLIDSYILYVYHNYLIKSLDGIPTKNSYTIVYLYNNPELTDISALLKCDRLEEVYISKCNKVSKDDLKKLKDKGVGVYKIDRVYMYDNKPELNDRNGSYSQMESLITLMQVLNGMNE